MKLYKVEITYPSDGGYTSTQYLNTEQLNSYMFNKEVLAAAGFPTASCRVTTLEVVEPEDDMSPEFIGVEATKKFLAHGPFIGNGKPIYE